MLFIQMYEPISEQRYHRLNSSYSTCSISIFRYCFYIRLAAAVSAALGKPQHREPPLLIASEDHKQKELAAR